MNLQPPHSRQNRRLAGLAATVALHLALLWAWHLARQGPPKADAGESDSIEWVKVLPPRPVKQAPLATRAPARPAAARRQAPAPVQQPNVSIATTAPIAAPASEAPPARSVDEMMRQARQDIGKIDKELSKEFPGPRIKAPVDTPQRRLEKGIELAAELAPPKWYEQAKIKEIIDPGPYGRKRYRVTTAFGTYCTTYESNHAPDGLDVMKNGVKPKFTNCPAHEQPATTQKWDQ